MKNIVIRAAISDDEPRIRACARQAYAPYVPLMGRRPAPMDVDYADRIESGAAHVAEDGQGAFQGFIVFVEVGDRILLENVAVLPSAAGRGVGRRLITFCEEEAEARGLRSVFLYTNARMEANLALYPRLGYAETDRRTEDGFSRVYFEKSMK